MASRSRAARPSSPVPLKVEPVPLKVDPLLFFKLKSALTQRLLIRERVKAAQVEADAAVTRLLKEAGVSPDGSYELDEQQMTITKVG